MGTIKKGWRCLMILNAGIQQRWFLLVGLMALVGLLVNMAGYEFFYWPNQYLLFCMIIGCINYAASSLTNQYTRGAEINSA